jgi:hypothetical protein
MKEFKTFMSLTNITIAEEIIKILSENKVDFKFQDTSKDFDVTFSNDSSKNSFLIMLKPIDFEIASKVLEDYTEFNIDEIDSQHPLFSFTNNELKDVILNYDEWHPLDVKLAKYLLKKEDIIIEEVEIKKQQFQKIEEAKHPEKSNLLTLAMGYLFCITGGLAGIGIAIFLLTGKKTLADGSKRYIYSKSDRAHGIYMLIIGTVFLLIYVLKYI